MASQEACIKIRTKSEIERSKHAAKNRKKQYKRQVKAHKDEEDKDAILEQMRMNDDGAGAPEPLPRREHQSHYRGAKHIDEAEGRLLGAHPFLPCPEPGNAGQITNLGAARFLSTRGSWDFPPPPVCPGGPGDEDPESDDSPNSQRKCLSSPNSLKCVTETTSDPTPSDHNVKNKKKSTSTRSPSTSASTDPASMPVERFEKKTKEDQEGQEKPMEDQEGQEKPMEDQEGQEKPQEDEEKPKEDQEGQKKHEELRTRRGRRSRWRTRRRRSSGVKRRLKRSREAQALVEE